LLDAVDIRDEELLSVLWRRPGGPAQGGQRTAGALRRAVLPQGVDCWVGINPMRRAAAGRGGERDVLRVAALVADVDVRTAGVKESGGVPDFEAARLVVQDISVMLGSLPVAVVRSGHGLQPYWAVEEEDSRDLEAMRVRLARFAELVVRVGAVRGGALDRLRDMARVWRMPGSQNCKGVRPLPVVLEPGGGRPLSGAEVDGALDAYAVPLPSRMGAEGPAVDMAAVPWAQQDCAYVRAMVQGWASDRPAARHPWLVGQAIRLELARRHGCFTQAGYEWARRELGARFAALVGRDPRREGELEQASAWAVDCASRKDAAAVAAELGGHDHVGEEGFWLLRPLLQWCLEAGDARYLPPDLLLPFLLAQVRCLAGPWPQVPPMIGSTASLNLGLAVVAASGGGKSASAAVIAEAGLPPVKSGGLGTAEGVADLFGSVVDGRMEFTSRSVLLAVDEVEALFGVADRQGSVMFPTLRTMLTGGPVRIAYRSKPVELPAREYATAAVLAGQPGKFQPMVSAGELEGGTPQRFVWFRPQGWEVPAPRGRRVLPVPPVPVRVPEQARRHFLLEFPEEVHVAVQEAWGQRFSGVAAGVAAMDSHRMLARCKVAALFALAEGRFEVSAADWSDSGALMRRSDAALEHVVSASRVEAQERLVQMGRSDGHRESAKRDVLHEAAVRRVAGVAARYVLSHGECTRKQVRQAVGRDRGLLDEALADAVERGVLVRRQRPRGGAAGGADVTVWGPA
jgi:hypothetical protein